MYLHACTGKLLLLLLLHAPAHARAQSVYTFLYTLTQTHTNTRDTLINTFLPAHKRTFHSLGPSVVGPERRDCVARATHADDDDDAHA